MYVRKCVLLFWVSSRDWHHLYAYTRPSAEDFEAGSMHNVSRTIYFRFWRFFIPLERIRRAIQDGGMQPFSENNEFDVENLQLDFPKSLQKTGLEPLCMDLSPCSKRQWFRHFEIYFEVTFTKLGFTYCIFITVRAVATDCIVFCVSTITHEP